ncbi:MAG: protein-(glutamine-N5) methyltransferase, release factor-specific, partial [bacterium]
MDRLEAEILLCHVLKTPRSKLFSHPERKLTRAEQKLYDELLDRRKKHEPIA